MFGIGMPEMILILAVALIVIGPKKLPDLAKSLGRALGEFKKATSELKDSFQIDDEIKEVKTTFDEINRDLKDGRRPASKQSEPDPAGEVKAETKTDDAQTDADPMDTVKAAFNRDETTFTPDARAPEKEPAATETSGSDADSPKA